MNPRDDSAPLEDGDGGIDLDGEVDAPGSESQPFDLAYRGTIAHFARGARSGTVRTASGREIPFDLEHVVVADSLISAPGQVDIAEGQTIGFDVGWTSRGLRITRLFPLP